MSFATPRAVALLCRDCPTILTSICCLDLKSLPGLPVPISTVQVHCHVADALVESASRCPKPGPALSETKPSTPQQPTPPATMNICHFVAGIVDEVTPTLAIPCSYSCSCSWFFDVHVQGTTLTPILFACAITLLQRPCRVVPDSLGSDCLIFAISKTCFSDTVPITSVPGF